MQTDQTCGLVNLQSIDLQIGFDSEKWCILGKIGNTLR